MSFNVTGFSGFFVKTIETPLPLNLISFTAIKETGNNLLQWTTTNEVNTLNFEVHLSEDDQGRIGTMLEMLKDEFERQTLSRAR